MAAICPHAEGSEKVINAAHGHGGARSVGRKGSHHAENGQRDHGYRGNFQSVQPAAAERVTEAGKPVRKGHQRDRRRQRKGRPGRQRTGISGPQQADGDTHLARGRARQELAERYQIRVGLFVEPFAAFDEFVAEVAEVSDRPAERCQAELEEGRENFPHTAVQRPAPRVRIKFTDSVPVAVRRYRKADIEANAKAMAECDRLGMPGSNGHPASTFFRKWFHRSRERFHRNFDVVDGCGVAYANARQEHKTGCGFAWLPHPGITATMAPEP
jgi:hypothetical protein